MPRLPIDPDGPVWILILLVLGFLPTGLPYPWAWIALPFFLLSGFCLWFFRDPERVPPPDPGVLVSPAHGRVADLSDRPESDWPEGSSVRIGIFLSVFDVHVVRSPLSGIIRSVTHRPGEFLAAYHPDASVRNERAELSVEGPDGTVRFRLLAGVAARRIIVRAQPGQSVSRGARLGIIRFGSRAEIFLPPGWEPSVRIGDRVRAGESIVARRLGQ